MATHNIRTLMEEMIENELEHIKWDIVVLSENRRKGKKQMVL